MSLCLGAILLTTAFLGRAKAVTADSWGDPTFAIQISQADVEAAIAFGNLEALGRIDKASRLESLYQAMIETEQARMALRQSMASQRQIARQQADATATPLEHHGSSTPLVEMTTYREDALDQRSSFGQVVTLRRPKKQSLQSLGDANQSIHENAPKLNDPRDDRYRPLVVTRPPTRQLQSATEQPQTAISIAETTLPDAAPARDSSVLVNESLTEYAMPTPTSAPQVKTRPTQTQQQLEYERNTDPVPMQSESPLQPEPDRPDDLAGPVDLAGAVDEPNASSLSDLITGNTGALISPAQPFPRTLAAPTQTGSSTAAPTQPRSETSGNRAVAVLRSPSEPAPLATSELQSIQAATPATGPETQGREPMRPDATVADAKVAMQWPFAAITAPEPLPTPQPESDVTLNVDAVDVRTVLEMLAKGYGMNILVAPDVEGSVTANVAGLTPEQTLNSVARMCSLAIQRTDNVILVYPKDNLPRESRQLRVFTLDFARSEIIEPTVVGLLSPIGSAYSSKVDELDNRKGRESIVVVDTPEVLEQVEQYILQADQAPLQVMIEARVLEIELKDDMEHGVNFEALFSGDLRVGGFRMSDNVVSSNNPFYFGEINGSNIKSVLTLLETTTDAKTLATPRIMVVNGQNAKIQVGQQLGFAVATVTQTSTIQDVRYLDTGVILNVTPTISRDDRILMQVKPVVSSGEINPDTLLPEATTREMETSVMLDNHQGMIVGGLIQEEDRVVIRKLPWLGDVKHIGKLFQRRETTRGRTEIIVALIPHIINSQQDGQCSIDDPMRHQIEWERTENRLFDGPLNRECRPWEARLPDVTGEDGLHRDIDRQRNRHPYCKGCEPIKADPLGLK